MSTDNRITLVQAHRLVQRAVNLLRPESCQRLAFAGSIRRGKPLVGDIELVVIPAYEDRPDGGLFGRTIKTDLLTCRLNSLVEHRQIYKAHKSDGSLRWGSLYKAFVLPGCATQIELFCANPDNWGVILAIRTGSAHFCRRLVTRIKLGKQYRVQGGYLTDAATGNTVPCPDEETLFKAADLRFIPPEKREVN